MHHRDKFPCGAYVNKYCWTTKINVFFAFKDYFDTEESAFQAVKLGKAWGALSFTTNYSASLRERIDEGQYASDLILDDSIVSIWLDESSIIIIHFVNIIQIPILIILINNHHT